MERRKTGSQIIFRKILVAKLRESGQITQPLGGAIIFSINNVVERGKELVEGYWQRKSSS